MALIICPDCSKEFSDLAQACPNCARPNFAASSQTPSQSDTRKFIPLVPPQKHNYGLGFVAYFVVFIIGIYTLNVAETLSLWKYVGLIFALAGGFGLLTIVLRVIFRLLQKV